MGKPEIHGKFSSRLFVSLDMFLQKYFLHQYELYFLTFLNEGAFGPELHDNGLLPERHKLKTFPSLVWS